MDAVPPPPPVPPPIDAPPTVPGPMPPPPRSKVNIPGLLGLIFCATAAIASPSGFLGFTLCLLVPLGCLGLIFSLIGCFFRPRWYGIAGLAVGLICLLGWGVFFVYAIRSMPGRMGAFGVPPTQSALTSMSCTVLVGEVEGVRVSTGALPATFTPSDPTLALDPWGRPYRYTLTPVTTANPYGYTFISDGPDGLGGTYDDLDLIAIHPTDGTFPLTPPPPPPPPAPSRQFQIRREAFVRGAGERL